MLVRQLLGFTYLWNGALNTIQPEVWAIWLLYAVLVHLLNAVAEELSPLLDWISVEIVCCGLYHFTVAHSRVRRSFR